MPIIRGEFCIGLATFFSFVSVVLLIFTHVGQINTSTIPRSISMVNLNASQYGQALFAAQSDPVDGLYTENATATLRTQAGLRQLYAWGFFSYCAYTEPRQGICSNNTVGNSFEPFDTIVADVPVRYQAETMFIIPQGPFTNTGFLASLSRAGFYLCLVATVLAATAMLLGIKRGNLTFFLSSVLAIIATLMLLCSAAIWTAVVQKAQTINNQVIQSNGTSLAPVPLGFKVSPGSGLWLLWSAFIVMSLSTVPYLTSCFTYRG